MITAGIAQLVEHHVANVNVASSSLVSRSKYIPCTEVTSGSGPGQALWLSVNPEFSLGVFILYRV